MTKYTIDATNKNLGRVASEAARLILGKSSPSFERNEVADVSVEVINAGKIRLSGEKLKDKKYVSYSGYPGGQKIEVLGTVIEKRGISEVIRRSVYKMIPKNKLQAKRIKLLKIKE